ncbi:ArsR/SmtB family transcription factor [Dyadobacter helix]|nr:metalloregulator ArsR/SmtB family transcription factor [Dyadobacter sp. CECT 9275]
MTMPIYDPFQALADPGRREILMMIAKEKRSINAIAENFEISRPAVSKHIKILHGAGFIVMEEKGRERFCILNQAGFREIQHWMDFFEAHWKAQLLSLDTLLKTNTIVPEKDNRT